MSARVWRSTDRERDVGDSLGGPIGLAAEVALGGKGENLRRIAAAGLRVPRWVALPAAVHQQLVGALSPGASPADALAAAALAARVRAIAVPEDLREELRSALIEQELLDRPLAVRSSATVEDGRQASFAGQFDTVLGVVATTDDDAALWDAIRLVWASAYGARALAYAGSDGAFAAAPPMAVLIQELIPARAAGVAFSIDPVTGDPDVAVVSGVFGLGESLVTGDLDADTWRVPARGAAIAELAEKQFALLALAGGGTRRCALAEAVRRTPSLSSAQALEVAAAARRLADALGAPQDIEWAFVRADGRLPADVEALAPRDDDVLVLLQTRPVTATGAHAQGDVRVWDNSNIVESYSGLTSPLTFTFARGVYEDVYLQFCRLLGVSEPVIEDHRHVFAHMLGLVRGRVYYNLLNWYRVLAMLPGYAVNREFMERMMGVREKLAEPPDPPRAANRAVDAARAARMLVRLVLAQFGLRRSVPAFHARVEAALRPLAGEDLSRRSPDELVRLYRSLEARLLRHWRAPLVNDFFAMIWFGVFGRLVERWLPAEPATLANDLLCGEGGVISTEPARRVMALARIASEMPLLRALVLEVQDPARLLARLRRESGAAALLGEIERYLVEFGDRCINELKLETITPSEDPTWVMGMLRAYVQEGAVDPAAGRKRELAIRREAEQRVRDRLGMVRRAPFAMVLRNARARIKDRENLRFERTRVFGVVRRIFVALGGHLARAGRLAETRDVFWLTREELFAEVEGTAVTGDLRALVALRRDEYARHAKEPPPPDRFRSRGFPADAVPSAAATASGGRELRGLGCCQGIVRAAVRIVRDPSEAGDLRGRILVAERTDPGWTLLFPTASGLLVQRGSLLSHSAIVAREMGIPCVVAIPALLETLRDGELVEMDGATGIVRRLDADAADR